MTLEGTKENIHAVIKPSIKFGIRCPGSILSFQHPKISKDSNRINLRLK
jgi:hypothetical protein